MDLMPQIPAGARGVSPSPHPHVSSKSSSIFIIMEQYESAYAQLFQHGHAGGKVHRHALAALQAEARAALMHMCVLLGVLAMSSVPCPA